METVWKYLSKLNIELPYEQAIPLLGIYPHKTSTGKDSCPHIVFAALFTITKTWKQSKCPSIDEWIKMQCIYAMKYSSALKKGQNNAICSNMDGTRNSDIK